VDHVSASVIRVIPTIARHHTAKQSRENGGFAPRGSGALGAAARLIRTTELAGEGGSRLLKVRPLKLSNRGRGPFTSPWDQLRRLLLLAVARMKLGRHAK